VSHRFERPRYLFLMRHADQREGHLTKDGSAQVRAVAAIFSQWMLTEWRCERDRRVRLWYTTRATEVQETVDLLRREVLAEMQPHSARPRALFGAPDTQEEPAGATHAVNDPEAWMATLPYLATNGCNKSKPASRQYDLQRLLSAYSPQMGLFDLLRDWLASTETGPQCARRTKADDSPILVGNDPLIGWLATKLSGRPTAVAGGELICLVQEARVRRRFPWIGAGRYRGDGRWRLLWAISEDSEDSDTDKDAIRPRLNQK
jgi:hypothetical protein